MALTFKHLDLVAAEKELLGAAMDHEHALRLCMQRLPEAPFRGGLSDDRERIFYILIAWLNRGFYDELENRDRLEAAGEAVDYEYFCAWGAVPEYVETLIDSVLLARRLEDQAVQAYDQLLHHNPLGVSEDLEDDVYLRLGQAVLRRRAERTNASNRPAFPRPVDWEGIPRRVHR